MILDGVERHEETTMKRTLLAALLAAGTLLAAPAHAVLMMQTYTGSVSSGSDFGGAFGPANTDLTGASFTATFVFDTTLGNTTTGATVPSGGTFVLLAGGTSPSDPYFNTPTPLVSATLSIGGSAAVSFAGGQEDRTAIRSFPVPGLAPSEYFASTLSDIGTFLTVFARSFDETFLDDLTHEFSYDILPGVVVGDQFRIVDPVTFSDTARGVLTPTRLVVSVFDPGTPEIPLPATLPLFAGGLGVLGLLTRRRRRRSRAS
jgi:hypothetical protein